jgi:hypothetical protein
MLKYTILRFSKKKKKKKIVHKSSAMVTVHEYSLCFGHSGLGEATKTIWVGD